MSELRKKPTRIEGSTRKQWISDTGRVLQYQHVYMPPWAWAVLEDLARSQGTSGSHVLEKLLAHTISANVANRQYC
jgi:hypothetical protein